MPLSIFNLFNIGIGPSSSHTVGPMRASNFFIEKLNKHHIFSKVTRIDIELCGSLSLTGIGHGTDRAVIAGLYGERPETTTPDNVEEAMKKVKEKQSLFLDKKREISFNYDSNLIFNNQNLPYHPNGMIFYAYEGDNLLYRKIFYSVGGGFIVGHKAAKGNLIKTDLGIELPYQFENATELLSLCRNHKMSISEITLENERKMRTDFRIDEKIKERWSTMEECIASGLRAEGLLPGNLHVKRRAKNMYQQLVGSPENSLRDPLTILDWVNLYALAVNEENAAGGRVVTAPTNGAAGIIPAVICYHNRFCNGQGFHDIKKFLLTAGTIGILYKKNASISGAEVGCQGEIGVACSMAAAGLTEVLGGTPEQVENAAEIGMEHNLGLTCDPVDGMVQIPCIERNAMGAIKAINAARIALRGSGKHFISLDKVIKTMKETGFDMQDKYKETAKGGLAVNVTAC